MVCIGLNPSTATHEVLDPTCKGLEKRAQMWGYDRYVMLNLFGWRSTDPKGLLDPVDPVGPGNDAAIVDACRGATIVIAAWGSSSPLVPARAAHVVAKLRRAGIPLHYLRMSESTGQPWHPLYLPHATKPVPWKE
jgi:hypothetical protein